MFGTNPIVGKGFFKDAPKDTLMVTSMFLTLQGEGPYSGRPCVFIRLTKCNLACSFCFPSHYELSVKGKGKMRMDEVAVGDQLLTLSDKHEPVWTTVKAAANRWVDKKDLVQITYREGKFTRKLICTRDHPFNVKGSGFVEASELSHGMVIHHLPGNEANSFYMTDANPMKKPSVARKVTKALKDGFETGRLTPYRRTKAWRENQSNNMTEKNPMHNNETVRKVTLAKFYPKSGLERLAHKTFKDAGFKVKYVGNHKDWLIGDSKHGYYRPDFWFPGTKKVIELYDRTYPFYAQERHTKKGEAAYKEHRKKHFARFGYEVMFVTAQDLKAAFKYESVKTTEIVQKNINKFLTNGVTVVSVEVPSTSSVNAPFTKAGTYKEGKVKVTNFTCDGNNTFMMRGLHTHNCDTLFERGQVMTFDEILFKVYDTVCAYWNSQGKPVPLWALPKANDPNTKLGPYGVGLVITGGEPTLQANLTDFLQMVKNLFVWTQIESNGIITLGLPAKTTVVVSPKCAEKDGIATRYLKPSDEMLARADALKFVMCAPREGNPFDKRESPYETVPEWAHAWLALQTAEGTGKQVFISPMNIYNAVPKKMKLELNHASEHDQRTMEERSTEDEVVSFWEEGVLDMKANRRNHEWAARYALEHGFRFQVQTHLLASLA